MNYIRGLSANMEDLPTKKGQEEAKKFWSHFLWSVKQEIYEPCYLKTTTPKCNPVTIPENIEFDNTIKEIPELKDIKHKNTQPQNFYGVGGMKIFRDLIYQMQGMMKADYRFFKEHGQFDFPQKKKGTILAMYLVGAMLSSKKVKAKMGNKMTEGMLAPYKKVLDNVKK